MDNAAYVALSRQMALFNQMDVIANNIANASTAGFKSEQVLFSEYVKKTSEDEKLSFSNDVATVTNFDQGSLRKTDRQLDVAIKGEGYFQVETPLGIRYTRVGNLIVNSTGVLTDSNGYPVQAEGGTINFDEQDFDIVIKENGMVAVKVGSVLEERGQIRVVKFENEHLLKKLPNSMYKTDQVPEQAVVVEDFVVAQGMLEDSNVNPTKEMTTMIKINRSVGTTAKVIDQLHELQRRAVSTISRQN